MSLANFSRFGIDADDKSTKHADVFFKVCLAGEPASGKTSFSKCTTQILPIKPDVAPSLASTQHQYFYKIKNGGKLHLDVVDVGPSGEREILSVRRSLAQTLFVIFVNLATVKQKVERSLFGKRTDSVIFHNIFKQDLKKWINLVTLASSSSPSSGGFIVVGTHKDFLSHQDELALQTVVNELRTLVNQISSSSSPNNSSLRCYGCFLSSCNDHSVFGENREGPKTVKQLWNFFCDLATKLIVNNPSPSQQQAAQQKIESSLRVSLNFLRHERGLRALTLHDLFLYSLTQGTTKTAMLTAIRKRQNMGDIALTKIRRGGSTKTSLVMIDLPSLSRVLNSVDSLRNKLASLPQLPPSTANDDAMIANPPSSSMFAHFASSPSLSASFSNTNNNNNFNANTTSSTTVSSTEKSSSATVEDVIKQINTQEKRDQIVQNGVITWEMMAVLGNGLIGGRSTREEKACLLWQMTLSSGYLIPSISALAAADCLLASSNSPNRGRNNNNMIGDFNCGAFVCTIGTRRRIPGEALDQLEIVQNNFHLLTRRIVFNNELQFSKQNLFSLFVGRLVNISNAALLCPAHLFECGAWLRDRSLPSARLFMFMEKSSAINDNVLTFKFMSSSETSVRAHAAFVIEVLQSVRAVFEDFEFHKIAQWRKVEDGNVISKQKKNNISSPNNKFASGPEDLSRLDLAFGS